MNTLVETIQKIGIFLIAAQAIMHFAPGTAYTKYIKLIVGIMVLVMFLSPVYQIITDEMIFLSLNEWRYGIAEEQVSTQGLSMNWEEMESYIEKQTQNQEMVQRQIEEEIKSRLNDEIKKRYLQSEDNHSNRILRLKVTNVIIKEMEPVLLRIVVYRTASLLGAEDMDYPNRENLSGEDAVNIDDIQISGIVIGGNEPDGAYEQVEENECNLAQWFADILGLEPDRVEVIVYGSDQ